MKLPSKIFVTLILISSINGRVIRNSSDESMKVQDSSNELAKPRTILPYVEDAEIQEKLSSNENHMSDSEIELDKKNVRSKRSYYSYTAEKRKHNYKTQDLYVIHPKQTKIAKTKGFYDDDIIYFPTDANDDMKVEDKQETMIYETSKRINPTESFENKMDNIDMVLKYISKKDLEDDNPIWDINEYRPRFSRASGKKPNSETSINKNSRKTEKNVFPNGKFLGKELLSLSQSGEPNECTLAVISCCSVSSSNVNERCFRELECDETELIECSSDFVQIAMKIANTFYKTNR